MSAGVLLNMERITPCSKLRAKEHKLLPQRHPADRHIDIPHSVAAQPFVTIIPRLRHHIPQIRRAVSADIGGIVLSMLL